IQDPISCTDLALVSYGAIPGTRPIPSLARSAWDHGTSAARFTRSRRQTTFSVPIAWSDIVMARSPMSRARPLATSTTKTDAQTDRKTFVTLRFAGDGLDPQEISAILPVT